MATYYARPARTGAYGLGDGSSYANAFNGQADFFSNVSAADGVTVYICGTHHERWNFEGASWTNLVVRGDAEEEQGKIQAAPFSESGILYFLSISLINGAKVIGMSFEDGGLGYPVMDLCGSTNCIVQDCIATNIYGVAFGTRPFGTTHGSGHTFINCHATDCGVHGFSINATGCTVIGCSVTRSGTRDGAHGFATYSPNLDSFLTGWTGPSSGVYSRELAYEPNRCINRTNSVVLTKTTGTTPAAGEYSYDTGTMYIRLAGDADANTKSILVNGSANLNIKYIGCIARECIAEKTYLYHEGHGFSADDGAAGVTWIGCSAIDCEGVGWSVNWGTDCYIYGCIADGCANPDSERWAYASENPHDYAAFSIGGTLNTKVINCTVVNCEGPGLQGGVSSGGSITSANNILYGGYRGIVLPAGATSTNDLCYGNEASVYSGGITPTGLLTSDPQLTADLYLGVDSLETAGLWIAGVRLHDDLPQPLNPPIGAKCRRDWPGRRFGSGGGKR